MKALVLGSSGQLGCALVSKVPATMVAAGCGFPECDITSTETLFTLCRQESPDVIINAAAYTAVDNAESDVERATAVNALGPGNVAAAANEVGARMIHISTDFVFDGRSSTPYKPDAATNPLSVYGRTKRDGELAVLDAMPNNAAIVRTAWLYSMTGGNFVTTMLRLMAERDKLAVVSDQFGAPTWADSLATAVWRLAEEPGLDGIFHWTDSGVANWHEFAVAIQDEALSLSLLRKKIPIRAIATEDYPTDATRPRYSVLDCSTTYAALGISPAPWLDNLRSMLNGIDN